MHRALAGTAALIAVAVVSLTGQSGGRAPRPPAAPRARRVRPGRLRHPSQDVRPRQRPAADRARGPLGAGRGRERLVSRRLAQRAARQDRVRAPVRALLLQRVRALSQGLPRGDGRPWRQQPQRHHVGRSHQLLRGRAGVRARAHALPGGRPPGVPGQADCRTDAQPRARRGAEREAPGREPALRPRVQPRRDAPVSAEPSLQLADHRQHRRPERRKSPGRAGLVPVVLWPQQLRAVARRRHHAGAGAGAGEEVLRRHPGGSASGSRHAVGAAARRQRPRGDA